MTESAERSEETTQAVEDSEDADGIPTVEEMRQKEDEEYARWFEKDLPEKVRVVKKSVA